MLRFIQVLSLLIFVAGLPCGCRKAPAPPPPAVALPEELPVIEQNAPPVPTEEWVTQPSPIFVDTADDIQKASRENIEMNGPAMD